MAFENQETGGGIRRVRLLVLFGKIEEIGILKV